MIYYEWDIKVVPSTADYLEIIAAELMTLGVDACEELPDRIRVCHVDRSVVDQAITTLKKEYAANIKLDVEWTEKPYDNWNREANQALQPLVIGTDLEVLAPHQVSQETTKHTVIVDPQMAFGSGHHPTTHMILAQMVQFKWDGLSVLDWGCGTGVLSIVAKKLGAEKVLSIDIDDWALSATKCNVSLNDNVDIVVDNEIDWGQQKGAFSFILANITRNVLCEHAEQLSVSLADGGRLLISGFLEHDISFLEKEFQNQGLRCLDVKRQNGWGVMTFQK